MKSLKFFRGFLYEVLRSFGLWVFISFFKFVDFDKDLNVDKEEIDRYLVI